MECYQCKVTPNKHRKLMCCDGCQQWLCGTCSSLNEEEIKYMQQKKRNLYFNCANCTEFKNLHLLKAIIDDKEKIISLLEANIAELKDKLCKQESGIPAMPSYANVLSSKAEKKPEYENLPCIIVEPNDSKQSCAKTRMEIENFIDPVKIGVGINMIKKSRNGSLLIKCDSKKSMAVMKTELQKSMGKLYEIRETQLRKPSFIIANISLNTKKEELVDCIKNQNSFISEEDTFEVRLFRKSKNGETNWAVVETNGSSFKKIMSYKKLGIKYSKCPVYENLYVPRCSKCNGYYHKAEDCRNRPNCAKCAEAHMTSSCTSDTIKCGGCIKSNQSYNTNYNVVHNSFDRGCPTYLRQLEILAARTDYSS